MRFLFPTIGITFMGGCAYIFLTVAGFEYKSSETGLWLLNARGSLAVACAVLVSFTLFLSFVLLFWRVIRSAFQYIFNALELREVNAWHRIAALALVAVSLADLSRQVFLVVYRAVYAVFYDVPVGLVGVLGDASLCLRNGGELAVSKAVKSNKTDGFVDSRDFEAVPRLDPVVSEVGVCVSRTLERAFEIYLQEASDLIVHSGLFAMDVFDVALAVLLFLAYTFVLSRVFASDAKRPAYWVGFAAISGAASYLALCALLAVPLLQRDGSTAKNEPEQDQLSFAKLEKHLNDLVEQAIETAGSPRSATPLFAGFDTRLVEVRKIQTDLAAKEDAERNSFVASAEAEHQEIEALRSSIAGLNLNQADARTQAELDQKFDRVLELLEIRALASVSVRKDRLDLKRTFQTTSEDMLTRMSEIDNLQRVTIATLSNLDTHLKSIAAVEIAQATEFYRVESELRLGKREAIRHYFSIIDWFEEHLETVSAAIRVCQARMDRLDTQYQRLQVEWKNLQPGLRPETYEQIWVRAGDGRISLQLQWLQPNSRAAPVSRDNQCSADSVVQDLDPPPRPGYGSSLGIIGEYTSWLLRTEEITVTLIVGLVGFGLLGAIVSRFARSGNPPSGDEGLADIAGVVFSGFVAALIVYVAAYGGLAITSETGGNPNPYVVFGACLVGAIYSGDVYQWAHKRMLNTQANNQDTASGTKA